ncbi:hypothetical protein BGZ63DRAFT_397036 [Mariannaea sp. PMI_226]|nr:hypothetical protein BGZ63DRAFT_397036 [Mariannaea sp. PMI_226]
MKWRVVPSKLAVTTLSLLFSALWLILASWQAETFEMHICTAWQASFCLTQSLITCLILLVPWPWFV